MKKKVTIAKWIVGTYDTSLALLSLYVVLRGCPWLLVKWLDLVKKLWALDRKFKTTLDAVDELEKDLGNPAVLTKILDFPVRVLIMIALTYSCGVQGTGLELSCIFAELILDWFENKVVGWA